MPGLSRPRRAGGAGRGHPQRGAGRAALRAGHAADRQGDERAHDQLRRARLGHRPGARLPLPADPSGDRAAVAADPATAARSVGAVVGYPHPPEACLVNFYSDDAKMGLHQDRDEQDLVGTRRLGVARRRLPVPGRRDQARATGTVSFRLKSGDVVVLGGEGRLRSTASTASIRSTSTLLKDGRRPDQSGGNRFCGG